MKETFERVDFDGAESVAPKLYKRTYNAAGKRTIWISSRKHKFQGNFPKPCSYCGRNNLDIIVYFISIVIPVENFDLLNDIPVRNDV